MPVTGSAPEYTSVLAGPSVVIDPVRFAIIAATSEALDCLGFENGVLPLYLDAAMPLAERLRAFALDRTEGVTTDIETLVFWGGRRLVTIPSELELRDRDSGPPVVLIRFKDEKPPSRYQVADDEPAEPPPKPRDDSSTLQAIAKAIMAPRRPKPIESDQEEDHRPSAAPQPAVTPMLNARAAEPSAKLAHEIKTPLGAILAAAEVMRDERLGPIGNERYREYAGHIHESAAHALAVISRLLSGVTGSLDSGLAFAEIDASQTMRACVAALQPVANQRDIKLTCRTYRNPPKVIADETSLKQILFNLLNNAIKFTEPGGIVSVSLTRDTNDAVTLTVRDSGPGMSEEEASPAFSDAAHSPSPRPGGGLGIGLGIVGSLARANGASLSIASESGKGTVVTLSFPNERVTGS